MTYSMLPRSSTLVFDYFACTTVSRSAVWETFSVSDRTLMMARAIANRMDFFRSEDEFIDEQIRDCACGGYRYWP